MHFSDRMCKVDEPSIYYFENQKTHFCNYFFISKIHYMVFFREYYEFKSVRLCILKNNQPLCLDLKATALLVRPSPNLLEIVKRFHGTDY